MGNVTVLDLDRELALALALADEADAITLAPFDARRFTVEQKLDRSEVTEIDRAAETAIVERLAVERPDHAVLGEEHGATGFEGSPWQWIIDPIDGTSGYVRGIPVWASLIALTHGDDVVVGVVSAPALGRRWWATRRGGAFVDGRPCRVSAVDDLAEAQLSVTFSPGWDDLGMTPALVALASGARRARGFGDFWQHALVAEGALDVAVDAVGVAAYDVAAVRLLVDEAGGRFTDRHGVETHTTGTAISTNGVLHDEVLRRLAAVSP
ncbi:MAG: inositol monophosphatase family protein [Ilumatobacteraceae bacterium]